MTSDPWFWAFNAVVLFLLSLDLFVFHRKAHVVSFKEAASWSAFWVSLSLTFCGLIWSSRGKDAGMEFLTAYLIEYALSMDNIFVFVLIFGYFKVKPEYQHRVLFWGIMGALVMRAIMIFVGVEMINRFHWMIYVFGVFLLFTGIKMILPGGDHVDLDNNFALKLARRWLRITPEYHGTKFVIRKNGVLMFTPLALVLIVVETTDLIFAVDSIPAVIGISKEMFIIYSSNICAILGLRSMYFMLARGIEHFTYLKFGLSAVLIFIGAKMVISGYFKFPTAVALGIVFSLLAGSVVASLVFKPKQAPKQPDADA